MRYPLFGAGQPFCPFSTLLGDSETKSSLAFQINLATLQSVFFEGETDICSG